jgi:glycosyltransferase involved in cell wall biosynthesis
LKYLHEISPVLSDLEEKYPHVDFLVIADHRPDLSLKNLTYKPWTKETEIADLSCVDIGIMPLPDDIWTKGKCGFKALQYMAMEIPAVVSPIGVNKEIVQNGIHGYWCISPDDWFLSLEKLILNKDLRITMGKEGRKRVIQYYSVESNTANFLSLFQ